MTENQIPMNENNDLKFRDVLCIKKKEKKDLTEKTDNEEEPKLEYFTE